MAQPQTNPQKGDEERGALSSVPRGETPEGVAALQRLRERVERAIAEIDRLRNENRSLKQQLIDFQKRPPPVVGDFPQFICENPEEVRESLDRFIALLDRRLGDKS